MIEREGGFKGFLPSVQFSDLLADQSLRDSTAEDGVWQVFVYQVAKEIAAYATALEGKLDAVLLTGELVNNETFLTALRRENRLFRQIDPLSGQPRPKCPPNWGRTCFFR